MTIQCQKCGRSLQQCQGFLERINEKGVEGIWECRPSCEVKLTQSEVVVLAIKEKTE